jgi:regulation of enolase protein 1 (concanavalin A-like superfamily)
VRDRAAVLNTIAANTQMSFLAVEFASKDIGNPAPGFSTPVPDGLDVVGGGRGVSTNADQIQFSYQRRTGDFDVQVRLQSLEPADVWASAGLMARESLRTNSPFASILATPSISGIFFTSRVSTNASFRAGTFPVNYPFTWLRLQRVGNLFTGYASFDGQTWTPVGAATNPLPSTILFGMAVSSHNPTAVTRAEFRDLRDVVDGGRGGLPIDFEPLGPSSRRTGLIISEIMFHPAARADGKNLEFIEMFNTQPFPEDISGFRFSGATDYTFPTGTVMAPGNFLVIARDPAAFKSIHGISNVLGGYYTNGLSNSAGTVRLLDRLGAVLLEAEYGTEPPRPAAWMARATLSF